jgi:methyl-accepting chemotaxis protein
MPMKIAHIADIHIRDKYFDYGTLLDTLHTCKPDIIVLAGDVIDSVVKITTDTILDTTTFLIALTSICPVVMIAGNHEINVNASDFFTVITNGHEILKPPRFNYWRHSGHYEFNNIKWTVVAPDEHIPAYEFDTKIQVMLFHETLDRFDESVFEKYNAVMAGHIHTRQLFSSNGAYCGSLFQQNIGESHNDHGYLLWELSDNIFTIKEINVVNKYSFLKVEVEKGVDVTEYPVPAAVVYYDIYHCDTSPDILSDIINKYKEMYGFKPRYVKDKNKYKINTNSSDCNESSVDITDITLHNTLIRQYLGDNNIHLNKVLDLHKKFYTNTTCRQYTGERLKLITLEFDNIYNFKGKQYINFTKMEKKLSGVMGPNNSGKTALIEVLLFMLYDVHPRTSTKKDILNKTCDTYSASLEFQIGNKTGVITKTGNNSDKHTCQFVYNSENLTQKTFNMTIQEIKKIVGSFNDANMSCIQLDYNFINLSSTLRRQKLAELFSLKIFETIESNVIKEISELNGKLKVVNSFKGNGITEDNKGSNSVTLDQWKIKCINTTEDLITAVVDSTAVESTAVDSTAVESTKDSTESTAVESTKDSTADYHKLLRLHSLYKNLINERENMIIIGNESKEVANQLFSLNAHINKITDANVYVQELDKIKNRIIDIDKKLNGTNDVVRETVFQKYNDNGINYLYNLCNSSKKNNELYIIASTISRLLLERDHYVKLLNISTIKLFQNQKIGNCQNRIASIDLQLEACKKEVPSVDNINDLYTNIFNTCKFTFINDLESFRQVEYNKLLEELEVLKVYRQVIRSSNGIIKLLIGNIKQTIEHDVNKLLNMFNMTIKIDNDFEISYYVDGYWLDVSLSSGYQKFVISIVFRLVLWQYSEVIVPDFLVIDEGFGTCDNENILIVTDLLKELTKLPNMPSLVIIVSHVNYLKDNIEYLVSIKDNMITTKHVTLQLTDTDHVTELLNSLVAEFNDEQDSAQDSVQGTQDSVQGTQDSVQGTQDSVQGTQDSVQGTQDSVQGTQDSVQGTQDSVQGTQDSVQGTQDSVQGTQDSAQGTQDSAQGVQDSVQGTQDSAQGVQDSVQGVQDSVQGVQDSVQGVQDSVQGVQDSVQGVQDSVQDSRDSAQGVQDSAQGVQDSAQGVQDSAQGVQDSAQGVQDSAQGVQDSAQGVQDSQDSRDSVQGVQDSVQGVQDSVQGVQDSAQDSRDSVQGTQDSVQGVQDSQDSRDSVQGVQDSVQDSRDSVQGTQDSVQGVQDSVQGVQDSVQDSRDSVQGTQDSVQGTQDSAQGVQDSQDSQGTQDSRGVESFELDEINVDKRNSNKDMYYCDKCNVSMKTVSKYKHLITQKHLANV